MASSENPLENWFSVYLCLDAVRVSHVIDSSLYRIVWIIGGGAS